MAASRSRAALMCVTLPAAAVDSARIAAGQSMVEYIDEQINHLSWQVAARTADITAPECSGDHIVGASKNGISVWHFSDKSDTFDQLPLTQVSFQRTQSSVSKTHLIGNIAFSALVDGTVLLHELVTERLSSKHLSLISQTKTLHAGYKCNDMLFCAQTNSVITCGNDGALSRFNIDHPNKISSKNVSESSLKCMDMVTPNEVICGTLTGCLKHFDLRTNDCIGSFASQTLSTLLTLQRNPKVNHLAMGGNDQGSIILYDLRNQSAPSAVFCAHSAAITNIKYRPGDTNILYSSCCDGDLFRWNLNTDFSGPLCPRKVESISCTGDPLSIYSFDVNYLGDMIYATDHGAIFHKKLNEVGQ